MLFLCDFQLFVQLKNRFDLDGQIARQHVHADRGAGRDADLFAYPLVGPNIKAFISLVKEFPKTHFYALEDDLCCLHALQAEAEKQNAVLGWFADVNMGMNRTGVETASEDR